MSRRPPGPFGPFDPFERSREGVPEIHLPTPSRRVWIGLGLIALAILLILLAQPVIGFWTEVLWYQALGLESVYLTRLGLEWGLFGAAFLIALAVMVGNVALALRLRSGPVLRTIGIRRRQLTTGAGLAALAVSVLISLLLALGASRQWQAWALFTHTHAAGVHDPVFHLDVTFYMFTLPFLEFADGWLVGLAVLAGLVVAGLHLWRGDTFELRLSPLAAAHLSGVMAALAALVAAGTWLSRYDVLSAHNGVVWGAGFADVHARIPMATFVTAVMVAAAVALAVNVRARRRWVPAAAGVAWLAAVIIGGLYPSFVQRVQVTPSELAQETPYIRREIAFTRRAYGLTNVQVAPYTGDAALTAQAVAADQATVQNLRLWDSQQLLEVYGQLQTIRTYYSFSDITLDRYHIAGDYRQIELSARELDPSNLPAPAQTWVNEKLQYTHGYGVAASPVNEVTGEGLPSYAAGDIPDTGPLHVQVPQIYFGTGTRDYVLAPSSTPEFDYPRGQDNAYTTYSGTHGVRMTGLNRALFSLRTGDFNLLISPQIQPRTEILFRRNVVDRVQAIAPFLNFDQPYVVVSGGKIYWIIDGYTTSTTYPYSQQETTQAGNVDYMKNSVKAVVDAYEGTVRLYISAPSDPVIKAYAATFPGLFHPLSSMPADLRAHIRVPPQLFAVQADVYRTYHVTDPQVFYNREDVWQVAQEQSSPDASPTPLNPYYVVLRLPGQPAAEYLCILPFTPNGKENLISWLAARNDAPHYGQLVSFVLPKDRAVNGPQQIANQIQQDPTISRDFSLFNSATGGSHVQQGSLLAVPVGGTFLYFEPVYLRATGATSLPELKKVILADAQQVVYADNLQSALSQLVGQQVGTGGTQSPPTPSPGPPATGSAAKLAGLAQQAYQDYQVAQQKLKAGDLAGYAQEVKLIGQILQQMSALQSGAGATPSPSPSPSPSP
ncbi:MAG: UPF0182 family protein [Candidatus Dormibacterales bacterium]